MKSNLKNKTNKFKKRRERDKLRKKSGTKSKSKKKSAPKRRVNVAEKYGLNRDMPARGFEKGENI